LLANTPNATAKIAVPLLVRERGLVGVMVLLCEQTPDSSLVAFVQALSGSMAVTLEARDLIQAQKRLFNSFVKLLAGAIDAKSAYTGGHCARVPELTRLLAEAAAQSQAAKFKDFQMSDDDWEALHIAGWLHDCGKITTPEFVVDKATKLETIYDRIHEVRTRFEVLWRDAEVAYWQGRAEGGDPAQLEEALKAEQARLTEDYGFVATCNEGGEFMADDKIARLKDIASRRWLRHFDDSIGIGEEEKARKPANDAPAQLPVWEDLLADKAEHLLARPANQIIPDDNRWGFRMSVPQYLYNRGELYNLTVKRGTLTEEDRYKINEHIVQTMVMLSELPFPKHLRDVPEIAGSHHEKMDGTGYPRRLAGDEINLLGRIMVVADIFEALTAVDRPYKKGKTLSEAVKIMSFMVKDHHLDRDLFELFLSSGAYRVYAEKFMRPEQIDDVEVETYLSAPVKIA
jgi:HD-GYP domain-containing protein (c-di-GMP phosphodiesterase class II)